MKKFGEKIRGMALGAFTAITPVAAHADQPYFMPDDVLLTIQDNLKKTGQQWSITGSDFKVGDEDEIDRLVCYDSNNNGVADRNITYKNSVDGSVQYGEVAYTRQSITAKTVDFYFDGRKERYSDMQTLSAFLTMQDLNSQGRSGVAVVYAQHESREVNGEMPIAYVISSTSTAVTIAQNPNWNDLRTPKQKFCDTLIIPAPGTSG